MKTIKYFLLILVCIQYYSCNKKSKENYDFLIVEELDRIIDFYFTSHNNLPKTLEEAILYAYENNTDSIFHYKKNDLKGIKYIPIYHNKKSVTPSEYILATETIKTDKLFNNDISDFIKSLCKDSLHKNILSHNSKATLIQDNYSVSEEEFIKRNLFKKVNFNLIVTIDSTLIIEENNSFSIDKKNYLIKGEFLNDNVKKHLINTIAEKKSIKLVGIKNNSEEKIISLTMCIFHKEKDFKDGTIYFDEFGNKKTYYHLLNCDLNKARVGSVLN